MDARAHILFAEDDPDTRELIHLVRSRAGFRVSATGSPPVSSSAEAIHTEMSSGLKSPPTETPTTPLIAPKIPYAAALYDNIQRLKLDVRTIVPFHGARTADLAQVAKHAGRTTPSVN